MCGVNRLPKPYLLVVTGRPGSGKTTFARELSKSICMPVISRDQIKEGYVHTFGKRHSELPEDTNLKVTEIFFASTKNLLRSKISLIAEAAFQHKIWEAMLKDYSNIARVYLLICKVDEKVALERYIRRGLDNPLREYFHGDKGVDLARQGIEVMAGPLKNPELMWQPII